MDPEDVTMYSEGSVKQPELDNLLPSVPSLPSFTLPNEISSKTTLGTDPDNRETKLLSNSVDSLLTTTPVKPEDEAVCEQKEGEAAQDHE